MNFPQFWARGESGGFLSWRWSSKSLAEAQELANTAARELGERIRAGRFNSSSGHYYPNYPLREQMMDEIKNERGEVAAIVTRNSYGCLVLNSARVMFVDIDLPEPKSSWGFFQKLFGKPEPQQQSPALASALMRIENWARSNGDWGWRIYRTRAGLRLLATHALVDADSSITKDIFIALGADPLYSKLCKTQKCFRARLTPKPWRCGVRKKPRRWPWLSPKEEQLFQTWDTNYQSKSANWATCELLNQIGNPAIHPEIQPIVNLHDERTRIASKLQLA